MRRFALLICVCLTAAFQIVNAQGPARRPQPARPAPPSALPIQRVFLYKNGVGYFEHLGKVRDNQSVTIDFNSAQLDDVLKSLTALDLGDGRVTGISYNSDAP